MTSEMRSHKGLCGLKDYGGDALKILSPQRTALSLPFLYIPDCLRE